MSVYSVSFAPRNSVPEILYFDNKKTAIDIAKLIVRIYTTHNMDVKVCPLDDSRVKVEKGLTKEILNQILSINAKSPHFHSSSNPPFRGFGFPQCKSATAIEIKSQGNYEHHYIYTSAYSARLAAEILKSITTLPINTFTLEARCPFNPMLNQYVEFVDSRQHGYSLKPVSIDVTMEDLRIMANSIICDKLMS